MPRARAKPLYETENHWIASDPGSKFLYLFWTKEGTGRTQRQSLRTANLEIAKERFAKMTAAVQKREPMPGASGVVYFIQAEKTGLVKIGWTTCDPQERLNSLSTASGSPLKLLGQTVGDKKLESALHMIFGAHREHREWFNPVPALLGFIEKLVR